MSSSILTNMSAMSAVSSLNATQSSLAMTESQISSGLAVSSAKDNAAYWSIATNMRTQNNDLSTVSSSLNLGASVLGVASSALTTMLTVLQAMQADVESAETGGTDKPSVGIAIASLQNQLAAAVSSASFNGVNLLDGSATASGVTIVSSVNGSGTSISVSTINVATSNFSTSSSTNTTTGYAGADTFSISASSSASDLAGYFTQVGTAIANVQKASEQVGATQQNIDFQSTFISALSDSITTGIGSLVDADMNAASTRLNALQTQQQLGIQALSVANQNSQIILKLFQ